MIGIINHKGLLVSREQVTSERAPVKIAFHMPITDESLKSLAAFAYGLAAGEKETMQKLGIEPKGVANNRHVKTET